MSLKKNRIALIASGSGTNAQAIIQYFKDHPTIKVVLLLSNNPNAYALQRASTHQIKNYVFTREAFTEGTKVVRYLTEEAVTHIVLAGFLWLIPDYLINIFPNKIINIHPALLPKYGGKGMYGSRVHEAIKAARETESGITIHLVNNKYDEGEILFQVKCAISEDDTPEDIARCVQKLEHEHYSRVIERWIIGVR